MKHQVSTQDSEYLKRFASCEVPLSEFHHKEHIRLAYTLLSQNDTDDVDKAYVELKSLLQNYLEHNEVPESKFHVTMTKAWLMAVNHFMHSSAPSTDFENFISKNEMLNDKDIMFSHYSREVILSDEARADFVSPDIEHIPTHNDEVA